MQSQKQRLLAAVEECNIEIENIYGLHAMQELRDAAFLKLTATIEAEFKEPTWFTDGMSLWMFESESGKRRNIIGGFFGGVAVWKMEQMRRDGIKEITAAQAAKLLNP